MKPFHSLCRKSSSNSKDCSKRMRWRSRTLQPSPYKDEAARGDDDETATYLWENDIAGINVPGLNDRQYPSNQSLEYGTARPVDRIGLSAGTLRETRIV